MTDETPAAIPVDGQPGVYRSPNAVSGEEEMSSSTSDRIIERAVGAAMRLGDGPQPSSELAERSDAPSGEMAETTADLVREATKEEIENWYTAKTTDGILKKIAPNREIKAGPIIRTSLGRGTTEPRMVDIGIGRPVAKQGLPALLPTTEVYKPNDNPDSRITRKTYWGEIGNGVVVDTADGVLEGETFTAHKRYDQRPATPGDMHELNELFAKVEQAHLGAQSAEIGQAQRKVIGPA